jgi:hypothetical protein
MQICSFVSRYFPPVVRSAFFTDLPETSFAGWPVIGTASKMNEEMQMCLPTTTLHLESSEEPKGHEVAISSRISPFPSKQPSREVYDSDLIVTTLSHFSVKNKCTTLTIYCGFTL